MSEFVQEDAVRAVAKAHGISSKIVEKTLTIESGAKGMRVGGIAADELRSIIERVERLEKDKANLMADIREVFAEAKGNGYDVKTLRQVIRLRRVDPAERQEAEILLDVYLRSLGMQPDLFDRVEVNESAIQ